MLGLGDTEVSPLLLGESGACIINPASRPTREVHAGQLVMAVGGGVIRARWYIQAELARRAFQMEGIAGAK